MGKSNKYINQEHEAKKNEIVPEVLKQLDGDGLLDLTDWIEKHCIEDYHNGGFVRSVGFRMERDQNVEVITGLKEERIYIKQLPAKKWSDKNPYLQSIKVNATTQLLSLIVGLLLALLLTQWQKTPQAKKDSTQDSILYSLRASQAIILKQLEVFQSPSLSDSTKTKQHITTKEK